jgi:hypothetical protein
MVLFLFRLATLLLFVLLLVVVVDIEYAEDDMTVAKIIITLWKYKRHQPHLVDHSCFAKQLSMTNKIS